MTSTLSITEAPIQTAQRSIPIELSDYARPSQAETPASDEIRHAPRSLKEDAVELPRPEPPAICASHSQYFAHFTHVSLNAAWRCARCERCVCVWELAAAWVPDHDGDAFCATRDDHVARD